MKKILSLISILSVLLLVISGCGKSESSEEENTSNGTGNKSEENASGMPESMVWSVYSVGSGTYNDMAAIADTFTKKYDSQIRLLPSDTGVGRMAPLKNKTADFARLGEEYIYAFEGELDFSNKEWGPQDVRMVWAPVGPIGLAVREDSGIDDPSQLKGKKVPYILSNPSVNNKMEAYLAYGGLTWDDVKPVKVSYSDQGNAFKSGQIEAILFNVFGSPMFELESAVKFKWLDLTDDSAETIARVAEVAPSVKIEPFEKGAGMKEGEVVHGISYSTPITAYSDKSEDDVYELVKAIDEQYDSYKDVTTSLKDASIEKVLLEPLVVPFHEGAIKYYKEKGVWTEEADQKNNELLERADKLKELWSEFTPNAKGEQWNDEWVKYKKDNLK
ncbi:TAXI family TRAP transporter solute-binding subunit [Sporosarcina obsidiansis]|uniref:TAXI family TRAP transporter solute-binding subunit n=1 Tax=Sporosarcina obsidiansis TaxID=2660748 RepID=UPI00189177A1|nr:TAXI family TRAP transporter solute-binding subunit [Sporosarcina obsidiansis]